MEALAHEPRLVAAAEGAAYAWQHLFQTHLSQTYLFHAHLPQTWLMPGTQHVKSPLTGATWLAMAMARPYL